MRRFLVFVIFMFCFGCIAVANAPSGSLDYYEVTIDVPYCAGSTMSFWKVADVVDDEVIWNSDIKDLGINLYWDNGDEEACLAQSLLTYFGQQQIAPDVVGTVSGDDKLMVTFEDGMYLGTGSRGGYASDGYCHIPVSMFFRMPYMSDIGEPVMYIHWKSTADMTVFPPDTPGESLNVLKVWDDNDNEAGERPDEVSVNLLGDGVVRDTVVLSNACNWRHTWTDLSSDVAWTVEEVDSLDIYNYITSYNVVDDTVVITNTFSIDIDPDPPFPGETLRLTKLWADDNDAAGMRPSEISVDLLGDGVVYDSVVLTSASGWRYTWSDLPPGVIWSVVETNVPEGYDYSCELIDDRVVITNTFVGDGGEVMPPPINPILPSTGGSLRHWLLIYTGGAACFLLGIFVYRRIRHKS